MTQYSEQAFPGFVVPAQHALPPTPPHGPEDGERAAPVGGYRDPASWQADAGVGIERAYRERQHRRGVNEAGFASGVMVISNMLATIQAAAVHSTEKVTGVLETVATLPHVNWSDVVLVTGAYATGSAYGRVRHAARFRRDVASGTTDGLLGRERLSIATPEARRRQHVRQAAGRAIGVAIGAYIAVKHGQHVPVYEADTWAAGSVVLASLGGYIARQRAQREERKIAQATTRPPEDYRY